MALIAIVLWSVALGFLVYALWKILRSHIKVYTLILMSGIYLAGLFIIYWQINGLPLPW